MMSSLLGRWVREEEQDEADISAERSILLEAGQTASGLSLIRAARRLPIDALKGLEAAKLNFLFELERLTNDSGAASEENEAADAVLLTTRHKIIR